MILTLIIDRFEGEQVVLKTENNETVLWPKNLLPIESKEGTALVFAITSDNDKEQDSKKLAKNILNEILKP
jgi:hypothetical protein